MRTATGWDLAIVTFAAAWWACGGAEGVDTSQLSARQSALLADAIAQAGVAALANPLPIGASVAAPAAPALAPVSFRVASAQPCPDGGQIGVAGTISGVIDDVTGNGTLGVDAAETLTSCRMTIQTVRLAISGTLSLLGNYVITGGSPAAAQRARVQGDLDILAAPAGSGRCPIDLDLSYNLETAARAVSGNACGHAISFGG